MDIKTKDFIQNIELLYARGPRWTLKNAIPRLREAGGEGSNPFTPTIKINVLRVLLLTSPPTVLPRSYKMIAELEELTVTQALLHKSGINSML